MPFANVTSLLQLVASKTAFFFAFFFPFPFMMVEGKILMPKYRINPLGKFSLMYVHMFPERKMKPPTFEKQGRNMMGRGTKKSLLLFEGHL